MTENKRKIKQLAAALVFFLVLGGVAFLIYRSVAEPGISPTVTPAIVLSPLNVTETKIFNVGENDYDFMAKIHNPNAEFGSSHVEYKLEFFGVSGLPIEEKQGSFFILPGQVRYLVITPIKLNEPAAGFDFRITSVDWQKIGGLAEAASALIVKNASYFQVSQGGVFGKAGGGVYNNSNFDFNEVEVSVVLFDENGTAIAVNRTEINTFLAKTNRDFEVAWFKLFVGRVDRIDTEAYTDIFKNSNFLRNYGNPEKFKQFF